MLILTPEDTGGLIGMTDALDVVEKAFVAWSIAPDVNRPRQRVHSGSTRVSVHPGGAQGVGYIGALTHCEKVAIEGSKQVTVNQPPVTLLYDAENGELKGIILGRLSGSRVDLRTAATSAYGTRLLARPDSKILGLFGAGRQAAGHLEAVCLALPGIREIRVFSPTLERCRDFATRMTRQLEREVRPVDSPREVINGADVVVCATNTNVPVFDGHWLVPGQHVTSIGGSNTGLVRSGVLAHVRREIDDATLKCADRIAVVSVEQAVQDQQGEIFEPIEHGAIVLEDLLELRDVVAGRAQGRTTPEEITVFMNNSGQGIIDVGLAGRVLDVAVKRGVGRHLESAGLLPKEL